MRKLVPFLSVLVLAGVIGSGCANTEKKFGRGLNNTYEIVRWGEFRRTMEQSAVFDGGDYAYSTGLVRGTGRTIARTGLGVYEMITAPLPPYDPIMTDYLAPGPVYPDAYKPGLLSDSLFADDSYTGFTGGDIAPLFFGSRFRIFDND
ncbi:MAG TPA: exosortase system-associated protein, TIGR04073 family [Candidatus Dormibacteraeota bacterium]|nr:exosortase system-associated protein, TIGR04073 family [Candidatus Dormibacteraeota bacterium]